ncbi:MAG: hypothetical protein U1F20_05265 [Lysobacterales bacterium]
MNMDDSRGFCSLAAYCDFRIGVSMHLNSRAVKVNYRCVFIWSFPGSSFSVLQARNAQCRWLDKQCWDFSYALAAFYSTFWGGLTLLLAALYAGSLLANEPREPHPA